MPAISKAPVHKLSRQLIDRSPRRLRPGVELVVRTVDDSIDDRAPGLAAEVAFYLLLSLPPLLLTVLSAVGVVGNLFDAAWQADLIGDIRTAAGTMFSDDTVTSTIDPLLDEVVLENPESVLGIGFLLTVVSASRATRVVSTAITIAYDREGDRTAWQQRLWGLGLTLGGIVASVVVVPVLVAGPGFGRTVADWTGAPDALVDAWRVLYWPLAVVAMTSMLAALYHLAAPWWTPWRRDLPGAALAMVLWLLGSVGLRVYAQTTITSDATYGPIAGPLVLMLWLYVCGLVVIIGAELNAEIEKMWPTIRLDHEQESTRPEADRSSREHLPGTWP